MVPKTFQSISLSTKISHPNLKVQRLLKSRLGTTEVVVASALKAPDEVWWYMIKYDYDKYHDIWKIMILTWQYK